MPINSVTQEIESTAATTQADWAMRIGRHRTPDGSVVIPVRIAAWLEAQAAVPSDRRIRLRGTDPLAYEVLAALHLAALSHRSSGSGSKSHVSKHVSAHLETWLTTVEVAERLGVTDRTVRTRIANGQLHATKVGGRWLLHHNQIEAAQGLA